ncbi:MAG: aminotransferase class I/II-fold pyridoxal phosphate-dependent enzyme [Phycisphaerales bacterium]|nr:aminotransferase class I/II-fold pyridoxal phosphate-dependent enzyme [Phycisphaerales bacterium]
MTEKSQNQADGVSGDPVERLAAARHEFGEHGGVNMSIAASTTFTVLEAGTMPEIFQGRLGPDEGGCFLYGRHFNPTVFVLGRQLAAMEGAEAGYCSASGLGAISAALIGCLDQGDHVVASDTLYGGTWAMLAEFLPRKCGITTTFVDMTDHEAVRAAFTDRTRVLYTESLTNPTLRVPDLPELSRIAHEYDARLMVDNTFAPLAITPIEHGADVVVHSLTKFINGASDFIAGAIVGTEEFVSSLMDLHTGPLMILGPTMDPQVAHSISLRLPHLHIRMVEHARRAQIFAERLQALGLDVCYPGLENHPDHDLFKRIGRSEYGYGGLLTINVGSRDVAEGLMEDLQNIEGFGFMAVSLGYFDTLMSCSASSTSSEMDDESLAAAGISPGLVRMSIGITGSVEQRWSQFERSLRRCSLLDD